MTSRLRTTGLGTHQKCISLYLRSSYSIRILESGTQKPGIQPACESADLGLVPNEGYNFVASVKDGKKYDTHTFDSIPMNID